MTASLTALAISLVSLLIAGFSLGWNIYRDVILKPRLKVGFQISNIVTTGDPALPRRTVLNITAVNHGPGRVTCDTIHVRTASLWRRLTRNVEHGIIISDWTNPLSGRLPTTLDVGQRLNLFLPYDRECFLASGVTHVGIIDSFGRSHWAPRRHFDVAERQYAKEFRQTESVAGLNRREDR